MIDKYCLVDILFEGFQVEIRGIDEEEEEEEYQTYLVRFDQERKAIHFEFERDYGTKIIR